MKKRSYKKLFAALGFFVAVCLIPSMLFAQKSESKGGEKAAAEDGRKYSVECQTALVEAQRRWETNPEDLAAARQPLIEFLKAPVEPIPDTFYQMLGMFWYNDDKSENRTEEARKIYKLGYESFPENDNLLLNYAVSTYDLERYAEAAPLFEKYYELNEAHDIKYLEYAAISFYTSEKLDEAKRVYLRMIGLMDTPESKWLNSLIYICQEQENSKDAEKYIRLALDYYPTDKNYWKLLAGIYRDKEDYFGLTAAYEIGARVKIPDQKSEWQSLIELYNFQFLFLRTAKSIQMGMDLLAKADGSSEAEQQLAVATAYARGARVDKAVSYIDSVIAKNPSNPNYDLKIKKATILYEARRNEEAMAALDECIAAKDNAYDAYYMKGWIAWDMKDWDIAERAFEESSNSREENIRYNSQSALDMLASLEKARTE